MQRSNVTASPLSIDSRASRWLLLGLLATSALVFTACTLDLSLPPLKKRFKCIGSVDLYHSSIMAQPPTCRVVELPKREDIPFEVNDLFVVEIQKR